VPIDDKKSINKKYVLQNSKLLKKYFKIPTESENTSLVNSGRFLNSNGYKHSHSNSNRHLKIHSNRSIHFNKTSKFKYFEKEIEESEESNNNPFLMISNEQKEEDENEIRERRKTSGSILNKKRYRPLEK
jgi:hypothetical protein